MKSLHVTCDQYTSVATELCSTLPVVDSRATVLALHGDLGAGKTTFTQALASVLGVTETVNSPTFVIQKQYDTANSMWSRLVHMDAYRLDSDTDLTPLRLSEVIADPDVLLVVEWPEHIAAVLPSDTVHIYFTVVDAETRALQIMMPSDKKI